jgi:hypothetical protein
MMNAALRNVPINIAVGTWNVGLMLLKGGVDPAQIPGRDDVVEVAVATHASYGRKLLGATTLTEPASPGIPSVKNDAQVLFDEAATAWGEVAALGIYDAATGGNLWAVLPTAVADRRTVRIGDRIAIPAMEIVITGYDGT